MLKATVSCDRLQHLILHNHINKDIANIAITHYRGKLLTLSGQALGGKITRAIIKAVLVNRFIYLLNLHNIEEPVLAIIYDMLRAGFISNRSNIREIYCNNNANYNAKLSQFVQNIQKQEITALINGASAIIEYKGKRVFFPLSPSAASVSLTANERDTSGFSTGLQKYDAK